MLVLARQQIANRLRSAFTDAPRITEDELRAAPQESVN
jgi:hypothetical protein